MNKQKWTKLLGQLDVVTRQGRIKPVDKKALDQFEKETGVALPSSYRSYCMVFGAGQLADDLNIAVPGYAGAVKTYSLQYLTQSQIELADQLGSSGANADQFSRSIFFATNMVGAKHFFDPSAPTGDSGNEYAVYTVFRDGECQRTAENFWELITVFYLGQRPNLLFADEEPAEAVFRPVNK